MKRFRLVLLAAGVVVLLLLAAVATAFNSSFQTWAARKAIASRPDVRATIGQLSAGLQRVVVKDLRYEKSGSVLTIPALDVQLPLVAAGMSNDVHVIRLVAKGWTLDLSKVAPASAGPAIARDSLPAPTAAAAQAFAGVFALANLPVDLAIDAVQLEGEVVLPESRGRVSVSLGGGGLGAGKEAKFNLVAKAALVDPAVKAVEVAGAIVVTMDTPRSFARFETKLDATAAGGKVPQGLRLTTDVVAQRTATGESYSLAAVVGGRDILKMTAELPRGASRLNGTWRVNVSEADVAPFALGKPLPLFAAMGEGKFDTDTAFVAIHVLGQLDATASRLEVLAAELAALGEIKLSGDFDVAERDGTIAVQKLAAAIAGGQPIATIRSLQAFEFNLRTGELRAADLARELFGVVLQGVPVAWAKPVLKHITLTGGLVRGELVANARGGGATLRSTSPFRIDDVTLAQEGKTLVEHVDLTFAASADYTPKGWQTEIIALQLSSGGKTFATLDAKAGKLAGEQQELKTTGKITADLPAVLRQPGAAGGLLLNSGEASVEFVASIGAHQEVHAKVALSNLATMAEGKPLPLPGLTIDARVDLGADGKIAFSAPVSFERNGRRSDLLIAGALKAAKGGVRSIEAQVSSNQIVVNDARVFAGVVPERKASDTDSAKRDAGAPPWKGIDGTVTLNLKRVIYSDSFEVNNLAGRLEISDGMVKLEGLQAGLGENGRANLSGAVTYNASVPQPYGAVLDVAIKDFDVAPLFLAIERTQAATIEGRFNITSKLSGRAAKLGELPPGLGGEFQLTSKAGVFRGLPVNIASLTENTGKLASWLATAGTAISSITGKKDNAEVANKAQAVAEFAKGLNPIPYDQLSIVLSRDAALNTTLRDFALISPELRLTGGGTALHKTGSSMLEDSVAMEFTLRARGRQGDLLKYLGVLESQPDDLGYSACTIPIQVSGNLAKIDAKELETKLVAVALEKSGVKDKAADLMNRLFGGGK